MKKLGLLLLFALGLALSAQAQTDGNGVERDDIRQVRQRARISSGIASGEINRGEARQLRAQQRHIRRVERRAEADGVVTNRERRQIARKQNNANRAIRRAKIDLDR